MNVAVGATIAAVAKKVLVYLLGDKKGRKFLLYTVCIALFIVCIPLIVLLSMFGWMSGNSGSIMNHGDILANLPHDQLVQIQSIDEVCNTIVTTFENGELGEDDQKKAKAIYMGYLVGLETQDGFYENLALCFRATTEDEDVYDLISETFLVVISEEDQVKYDELYGVTPARVFTETEG